MTHRALALVVIGLATATASFAQSKEPIPLFVADVRGVSAGLPTAPGWTPVVPTDTEVPSRALGFEGGAHVHVLRSRWLTLGVGATWLAGRATARSPEPVPGTPSSAPPLPEVTTRMSSLTPQVSLNFGHSLGWSYVSVGLGQTRVESEAISSSASIRFTPRESGWVKTLNWGGGARWFINERLGIGFDVRWRRLSLIPASATHPGAPRASTMSAGVGISLK
jgi:hypothetical protein